MKINYANGTIELSKAEAKKAGNLHSKEYTAFNSIRKEFPTFKVVVVSVSRKATKKNRITLEDMRRYISFHDDDECSKMRAFEAKCHAKEHGELTDYSFFEIKKWFFEMFPEVA